MYIEMLLTSDIGFLDALLLKLYVYNVHAASFIGEGVVVLVTTTSCLVFIIVLFVHYDILDIIVVVVIQFLRRPFSPFEFPKEFSSYL